MAFNGDTTKTRVKVEFDVNLTCKNCAIAVEKSLSELSDVFYVDINVDAQSVIVETWLPTNLIKDAIESTGKKAVLKGFGSHSLGSAVAEFKSNPIYGVIRFHHVSDDHCVIDGTLDGLSPGNHALHIHEYGDLTNPPTSIGPYYGSVGSNHGHFGNGEKHLGNLGNITVDSKGRTSFRLENVVLKVDDIIGRSIAVNINENDLGSTDSFAGNSENNLACAIIARSAGLFQNPKRICQCDGVSIWDEDKNSENKESETQAEKTKDELMYLIQDVQILLAKLQNENPPTKHINFDQRHAILIHSLQEKMRENYFIFRVMINSFAGFYYTVVLPLADALE